jgi:hypothetical protein
MKNSQLHRNLEHCSEITSVNNSSHLVEGQNVVLHEYKYMYHWENGLEEFKN